MSNLQLGVAAFQSGNLELAKSYFEKQLELNAKDPDVLQLLGLVYSKQGKLDSAIEMMSSSLVNAPEQPHVLNNLGNCYKQQHCYQDAIACYEKAIQIKPDYVDAYTNLVLTHLNSANYLLAKQACENGLSKFPQNYKLLKYRGLVLRELGQLEEAISVYRGLLREYPQQADIHHDLGVVLRIKGDSKTAISCYAMASNLGLDNYQLSHNMANAYSDLGDLSLAIDFYGRAIQQNPGYVESHKNLNELLWESGDEEKLLKSYFYAFERVQQNFELSFSYVRALLRFSQYQQAYEFLSQLDKEHKQWPEYFDLLGQSLKGLGRTTEALDAMAQGVNMELPSNELITNYAVLLIECKQIELARLQLEKAIENDENDQMALAYLETCKRIEIDNESRIQDEYANYVREFMIDIPNDFESIEDFCLALKSYLDSLHTSEREPYEQTLKKGTQTRGNIFDDQNNLIQTLRKKIEKCIVSYIEEVGGTLWNSKQRELISNFHFTGSWSVRLTQQGFHVPHIHPMGWISSCFYVQLPEDVDNSENCQGWFQIGQPKLNASFDLPPVKKIKPLVGKLVLFPSFLWHGTIPFESNDTRTTVAFDVAPKNIQVQ